MIGSMFERRVVRVLTRWVDRPAYPAIVGSAALAATLSMTVPFASLLIVAVLLAPRRWKAIVLWSSLGSAIGAGVLYLVFHHLGWARLFEAYPELTRSRAWADVTRWLSAYGVAALFVIAGLPVPDTPALMFAGIYRLPVVEVLLALFLGKLIKYGVYAGLTAKFPGLLAGHWARYRDLAAPAPKRPQREARRP